MSQRHAEDWDALIAAAAGSPLELARLADRMVDGELPKVPVDAATERARALCYRAIAAGAERSGSRNDCRKPFERKRAAMARHHHSGSRAQRGL